MTAKIIGKPHHPHLILERMLHRTTLSTQRLAHNHIVDLGGRMVSVKAGDSKEENERQLQDALEEAEQRATRELRAALKRLRHEKEEEKRVALEYQKQYYERLTKRIEYQRDLAEDERIRELTKKLEKEKQEALQQQWEECEKIKEQAIIEACTALRIQLRNEFAIEKEKAIAEALRIAREKFRIREKESIERTRKECEEKARLETERVAKLHQEEIDRLNYKYDVLEQKYFRELDHKRRVEQDFRALQEDYQRFMDYTDGKFHSDYLMHLRHLGMQLATKRVSDVSYEDIVDLFGTDKTTHRSLFPTPE